MLFKKQSALLLTPLLLIGCSGGVKLLEVPQTEVLNNPTTANETKIKKVDPVSPGDFSEMGYSIIGPVWALHDFSEFHKIIKPDPDSMRVRKDTDYSKIIVKKNGVDTPISIAINGNSWDYFSSTELYEDNGLSFYFDSAYEQHLRLMGNESNWKNGNTVIGLIRFNDFKVTADPGRGGGFSPIIFYYGKNKTTDVPTEGTAHYKGLWEFARQVKVFGDDQGDAAAYGDAYLEKNKASFDVDFGAKTLTGKVKSSKTSSNHSYDITAKVQGNSFTGTAKGSTTFHDEILDDTAKVSGSFYGPEAKELAGRLNSDNGRLAGVFIAKQESNSGIKTEGDLFHAGVMSFDNGTTTSNGYETVNFSGDVNKVQVDGAVTDVDTKAKTKTVNYGTYTSANNGFGLFVQGHATKKSEVPEANTVEYKGSWNGYGAADNGAIFSKNNMDALFTADFASKTVKGRLFDKDQDTTQDAPVQFDATINGNQFSGTSTIKNLRIDRANNSTNNAAVNTSTPATVSGHFYGKDAVELGGHIEKDDHSFSAVFGGTQIEK